MNPTLPPGNNPGFFGQKVSLPNVNVNSAGDNQLILKDTYNQRIYYDADGTPTVLLGQRESVTPIQLGLFVSQPGIDVTQATDEQLIFNSGQDVFKIVGTGTITTSSYSITDPGVGTYNNFGGTNQFIEFDLDFVPGFIGFVQANSSVEFPVPWISMATGGSGTGFTLRTIQMFIIGDRLEVSDITLATGTSVAMSVTGLPVRYYLIQETAAPD